MNYPPPDLAPAGRQSISGLDDAIRSLDHQTRNRVELSLQWFFRASEAYGIDGFLVYWFALAILAMPRRSGRLAALERQIAEIYISIYVMPGTGFAWESSTACVTTSFTRDFTCTSRPRFSTIWPGCIRTPYFTPSN
jgi:hypothetical protein